jgi:hypothetical protein
MKSIPPFFLNLPFLISTNELLLILYGFSNLQMTRNSFRTDHLFYKMYLLNRNNKPTGRLVISKLKKICQEKIFTSVLPLKNSF